VCFRTKAERAAAPVAEPGGGVCWMTGDLRPPIRFGYFFVIL
jgi:hypothetical protein